MAHMSNDIIASIILLMILTIINDNDVSIGNGSKYRSNMTWNDGVILLTVW